MVSEARCPQAGHVIVETSCIKPRKNSGKISQRSRCLRASRSPDSGFLERPHSQFHASCDRLGRCHQMGQRDLEQIGDDEEDNSENQRGSDQRQRDRSHQPPERRQERDHADVEKGGEGAATSSVAAWPPHFFKRHLLITHTTVTFVKYNLIISISLQPPWPCCCRTKVRAELSRSYAPFAPIKPSSGRHSPPR